MVVDALINAAFGPYILRERLGQGGVASVYRAEHRDDRSSLAVKVLHQHLVEHKEQVKALRTEFDILSSLGHNGLPAARRFGAVSGRPAFAMELIKGQAVHLLLAERQRFDVMGTLLAAVSIVAHLHKSGIIHNDIKLENLILTPQGRVALIDFGNARKRKRGLLRRLLPPARGGKAIFGTASYLAPELILGNEASTASDCYALGVCAHWLLAGSPPFSATRRTKMLNNAVRQDAESLLIRLPGLPSPLAAAFDRCLAKDPDDRPHDAIELRQTLAACFNTGLSPADVTALVHHLGVCQG